MKASVFALFLIAAGAAFALSASTAPDYSPVSHSALNDDSLAHFAELVKETELRRRVNVLYPKRRNVD